MEVNRIGYQPNFGMKFVNGKDLMEFTKKQYRDGTGDVFLDALDKIAKKKKNVMLDFETIYNGLGDIACYKITNLYNGKHTNIDHMPQKCIPQISLLSVPSSRQYKDLFSPAKLSEKQAEFAAKRLANQYFSETVPDYTLGRELDKSF